MIPLADYAPPSMPTEGALRAAWHRTLRRFGGSNNDDDSLMQRGGLERARLQMLDDLADPPACAPVLHALEQNLGAWASSGDGAPRMQLVVVAPCDRTGAIEAWARSAGHALLAAPSRSDLLSPDTVVPSRDLAGDGLLVVPRLEQWFLRQRNGLRVLRLLLAQLAASDRRCLVACDSWAWAYLSRAADAELVFSRPCTFAPFGAPLLHQWFSDLATAGGADDEGATFRLASNGDDVLACNDDGQPASNWLRKLAARSGGIPWVAWHLWRASLQRVADDTALSQRAARAVAGDRRTVWVVDVDDPRLPPSHEDRALLALHALLIHGSLTSAELGQLLPATGEADVLPALVASGHVRCENGHCSVHPTAYPAVCRALRAAGFPTGAM